MAVNQSSSIYEECSNVAFCLLHFVLFYFSSKALWGLRKNRLSGKTTFTPTLTIHSICWWWFGSIRALAYLLKSALWRPDRAVDPTAEFVIFLPAYCASYITPFSETALSIDRCLVLLLSPHRYSQVQIPIRNVAVVFILTSYLGTGAYLIQSFAVQEKVYNEACWQFTCVIPLKTNVHLSTYGLAQAATQMVLSTTCLAILFRKKGQSTTWKSRVMTQLVKFTVITELAFHVIPVLFFVVLNYCKIDVNHISAPLIRALYVLDGVVTSYRYRKILNNNANKSSSGGVVQIINTTSFSVVPHPVAVPQSALSQFRAMLKKLIFC